MLQGVILKGVGGLYEVDTQEGLFACKPRGIFRHRNMKPLVGDYVSIEIVDQEEREGWITEIHERTSSLLRPSVANVEQVIVTIAAKKPAPNFMLLDKMLILIHEEHLKALILVNKVDLGLDEELIKRIEIYRRAGYEVLEVSTKIEEDPGLALLKDKMRDKISVFAGASGVGKSSLTNAIMPGLQLQTGEVSDKIKRGRHTTRHTELIPLPFGGWIVDTPGFTALDLEAIAADELEEYFIEFEPYRLRCKFGDCQHVAEPGCAVKEAVSDGHISQERYDAYLYIRKELRERKERY